MKPVADFSVCRLSNFWEAVLHLLHKSDTEGHVWNFLARLCTHLDSVGKSSAKLLEQDLAFCIDKFSVSFPIHLLQNTSTLIQKSVC